MCREEARVEPRAAMTRSVVASAQIAGRNSTAPSAMAQKAAPMDDVLLLGVVPCPCSTCLGLRLAEMLHVLPQTYT